MKKNLLVAALIAGFAGVTHAQSAVTLYGIIDTGLGYEQQKSMISVVDYDPASNQFTYGSFKGKRTKTGMRNGVQSGSRWGLKGVEDLGGGLRAVFVLENGFDSSTGYRLQGDRLFGRQATVSLASDSWGQLDFGRQPNIGSKYMPGVVDPFSGGFGQANSGATLGGTNMVRYDNMIMYQTPNFSGFQFGAGYSFAADGNQAYKVSGTDDTNIRSITTGLRYLKGPISIALTYDQKSRSANSGTADTTAKQWNIGAAYDFEVVKLSAAFGQTRDGSYGGSYGWNGGVVMGPNSQAYYDGLNPNDSNDRRAIANMDSALASQALGVNQFDRGFKSNSYVVGLTAPIGGVGTLMASWQMADPRSNPERISSSKWSMAKFQTYSLGYLHQLSKRTNLYALGSYAKNQDFIDGNTTTVVAVGLRHRF